MGVGNQELLSSSIFAGVAVYLSLSMKRNKDIAHCEPGGDATSSSSDAVTSASNTSAWLRTQEATYTTRLPRTDVSSMKSFLSKFYQSIWTVEQRELYEQELEKDHQFKELYHNLVVHRQVVSYEDFWLRYEYRCGNLAASLQEKKSTTSENPVPEILVTSPQSSSETVRHNLDFLRIAPATPPDIKRRIWPDPSPAATAVTLCTSTEHSLPEVELPLSSCPGAAFQTAAFTPVKESEADHSEHEETLLGKLEESLRTPEKGDMTPAEGDKMFHSPDDELAATRDESSFIMNKGTGFGDLSLIAQVEEEDEYAEMQRNNASGRSPLKYVQEQDVEEETCPLKDGIPAFIIGTSPGCEDTNLSTDSVHAFEDVIKTADRLLERVQRDSDRDGEGPENSLIELLGSSFDEVFDNKGKDLQRDTGTLNTERKIDDKIAIRMTCRDQENAASHQPPSPDILLPELKSGQRLFPEIPADRSPQPLSRPSTACAPSKPFVQHQRIYSARALWKYTAISLLLYIPLLCVAAVVWIRTNDSTLGDVLCTPIKPGRVLTPEEGNVVLAAPWWAPESMKESSFEFLCSSRGRRRAEIEIQPNQKQNFFKASFIDLDDQVPLLELKRLHSLMILSGGQELQAETLRGKFSLHAVPWARNMGGKTQ